jgi:hypothetical protein
MDNTKAFFSHLSQAEQDRLRCEEQFSDAVALWLDCGGSAEVEVDGEDYLLDHGTSGRYMVWLNGEVIAYSQDEKNHMLLTRIVPHFMRSGVILQLIICRSGCVSCPTSIG